MLLISLSLPPTSAFEDEEMVLAVSVSQLAATLTVLRHTLSQQEF